MPSHATLQRVPALLFLSTVLGLPAAVGAQSARLTVDSLRFSDGGVFIDVLPSREVQIRVVRAGAAEIVTAPLHADSLQRWTRTVAIRAQASDDDPSFLEMLGTALSIEPARDMGPGRFRIFISDASLNETSLVFSAPLALRFAVALEGAALGAAHLTDAELASAVPAQVEVARVLNPPPLEYPSAIVERRVPGRAVAVFVVDPTGRVDPESINIVEHSGIEFERAARRYVRALNFAPASVGGRPVPQSVTFTLEFDVPQ